MVLTHYPHTHAQGWPTDGGKPHGYLPVPATRHVVTHATTDSRTWRQTLQALPLDLVIVTDNTVADENTPDTGVYVTT